MKTLIFCLSLLLLSPAYAEEAPLPKGALSVEADEALEWNQNAQTYTARGNAVAVRDGLTVKGSTIVAHYNKSKSGDSAEEKQGGVGDITRFVVDGNVTVLQAESKASGDHLDYDMAKKQVVMTGKDLKLTTPDYIVTARDSMEYNEATQTATARGDAATTQGDKRLSGDVLNATFIKDATGKTVLDTLKTQGHAIVTTPDEIIIGDRGTYNAKTDIAIMDGNVKITRGGNQMNGDRAEINNKTGISRLLAVPGAKQTNEGTNKDSPKKRVRALIIPKK